MIGPQLYVGSWRKFVEMGFLANPKCIEIRTKLTREFKSYYDTVEGRVGGR
jgi:superfamily II DNA or RNA helicase